MIGAILGALTALVKAVAEFIGWRRQRELLEAGRAEERAARAEADMRVAQEQGAIMAEERTRDDAARRLRDGTF